MATPAPALDIRGLTVRYPATDRDALGDVSLEIDRGGFVSLAGRNGAGKSTLSLVAAGLLPAVIRADVRGSIAGPSPIGLVLSDPAAGLTGARASVREEVAFGLENLGVPRSEMDGRIQRALEGIGVEHLGDRAPETLSGGEQQRVAIAAALAMEPSLLVLDEASAELDPAGAEALARLLRRLADGGTAILAADHATTVLGAADRTVVLEEGAVVAETAPWIALQHPALADGVSASVPTGPRTPHPAAWAPIRESVGQPGVELRGVAYRYPNGVEALRGVDLEIPPGQAVAIVGPNGSGKSTLAKVLMGLLRPSAGFVTMDSADLASVPGHERLARVGSLFQDPREQLFGRTVERAVAFGPRNLRLPAPQVESLVAAALAATGLADRRATNPHDLDLAARKQVALAGALAMDPGIFVLDEPTTGQDRRGLARVEAVLAALREAGRTVVAVTHDLDLAARAFDRVIVMRGGEIAGDAPSAAMVREVP